MEEIIFDRNPDNISLISLPGDLLQDEESNKEPLHDTTSNGLATAELDNGSARLVAQAAHLPPSEDSDSDGIPQTDGPQFTTEAIHPPETNSLPEDSGGEQGVADGPQFTTEAIHPPETNSLPEDSGGEQGVADEPQFTTEAIHPPETNSLPEDSGGEQGVADEPQFTTEAIHPPETNSLPEDSGGEQGVADEPQFTTEAIHPPETNSLPEDSGGEQGVADEPQFTTEAIHPPETNSLPEDSGGEQGVADDLGAQAANPLFSPYSVDQSLQGPALHLPQPPGALHLQSVPLPNPSSPVTPWAAPAAPTREDVFPVDLTSPVDFRALACVLDNVFIPENATIYVLTPSRRCLLQVPMQGSSTTTFGFIQFLRSKMTALLTREEFSSWLSPAAQQAVHQHFLSRSRNGERLWNGFVNGARAPRGPKGVVLLQGHYCLWGFSQNQRGEWIMHVDLISKPWAHYRVLQSATECYSTCSVCSKGPELCSTTE
ncbi:hypothetical protein B0H16DRAFT_508470 [Mycena metata]|uniref:Uncharacterized protein n=1 Tax=Mycena metata TaxID=1033252 RepID=A0AAD7H9I3_9AGAR|nr:hypothetical protein B0H16DRAFT_508470 [Mycena metata]